MPNLPDITPDLSNGMPGAAAVAQLLALAGGGNYQLGDQQRKAFAQSQVMAENARRERESRMQQEEYVKGQEEQDFNRALQLVQAGVKPQDAFAAAPRTPGNRLPVLDAIYKQGQEARKLEEQKAEQGVVRGLLPGAVGGLAAMPSDALGPAVEGLAGRGGIDPEILNYVVQGARAKQEAERREFDYKEGRKDARARMGSAVAQDPYEAAYAREEGKRDARVDAVRGNQDYRGAKRRGASDRLALAYAEKKGGVFADPILMDVPREGGVQAQNKLAGTVQAFEVANDVRALTEVVAKYAKGGVGSETIADVGRRVGNPQAFESAFQAARGSLEALLAKSRSGLTLNETELGLLNDLLPMLSEAVIQDGKLAKGAEGRLRMVERELETAYWSGVEPRIARSQKDELRKIRHKQKNRRRGHWEDFLTDGKGTKSEATLEEMGLFE
jgi:hypothetical protein